MKVSHVIYKVENLDKAVEDFRKQGYQVEYGSLKHPYNAIIYFSEGPYLELLASTGMPAFMKRLLRAFGKGRFADRLDAWDSCAPGPCAVALENYRTEFDEERALLDQAGQGYFIMPSRRNDTHGRKLRFTGLFPDEMQIPFMMTYFNIDPKPKNFVHPNGALRIKRVAFGTQERLIPLIRSLCDDDTLALYVGEGTRELEFTYATGSSHT